MLTRETCRYTRWEITANRQEKKHKDSDKKRINNIKTRRVNCFVILILLFLHDPFEPLTYVNNSLSVEIKKKTTYFPKLIDIVDV